MNFSTQRFIERFGNLKKYDFSVSVLSCIENNNKELLNKFNELKSNNEILELYHATRSNYTTESADIYKSIMNDGFRVGLASNKGYGVYLANHLRYSTFWSGTNSVLVCNVISDKKFVTRYKSEIKSDLYDSEYVVSKPKLIYPKHLIEYKISMNFEQYAIDNKYSFYVEHGKFGCPKCDSIKRRCDCAYDDVDKNDII